MPSEGAPTKVRRRTPDEIHLLLLDAASPLFAEQGYAATTTREIATAAGVPEVMLYRHFGSKGRLFSEASLQPFNDFLGEFAASWGAHADETERDEEYMREFVGRLYDLAVARRKLIVDLLAAAEYEPEILAPVGNGRPLLDRLAELAVVGNAAMRTRGVDDMDTEFAVRAIISMVTSTAVLGPLLFGGDPSVVDRDYVVDELSRMARHAIGARPRQR